MTKPIMSPSGYEYRQDPVLLRQGRGHELVDFLLNARAGTNKAEHVPQGKHSHILGITHLEADQHLVRQPTEYRPGSHYSVQTSTWLMSQALVNYLDLGGYPSLLPEAGKDDIEAVLRELASEFHYHAPVTLAVDLCGRGTAWIRPCLPTEPRNYSGKGPGLSLGTFLVTEIDGGPRRYLFINSMHSPDVAVSAEVFRALTGDVDLEASPPASSPTPR